MFKKEDLELLEEVADAFRESSYHYSACGDRGHLFYSIKEKMRGLMIQRITGSDDPFAWSFGDANPVMFSSPVDFDGWETDEMWCAFESWDYSDCISFDVLSMGDVFNAILELTYCFEESSFRPVVSKGDLSTSAYYSQVFDKVSDYLADREAYCDSGEELDRKVEDLTGFLIACDHWAEGRFVEAMEDETFYRLAGQVQMGVGESFSDDFVVENLPIFLIPYLEGVADRPVYLKITSSEELFWYDSYRDILPREISEVLDEAIRIYENPYGWNEVYYSEPIIENRFANSRHITAQVVEDMSWEEISLFWKDIRRFLAETLPALRKRYAATAA